MFISSAGLIRSYIFKAEKGHTASLSGVNHLHMYRNFFVPQVVQVADMSEAIFQQDVAPAHYSKDVSLFLNKKFPNS